MMDRDKNNRKIAEWLGVPCWHEQDIWHCKKCEENLYEVEKATGRVNPDYYTPEGFFALLDGLRAKDEGDMQVRIHQGKRGYSLFIDYLGKCVGEADSDDLPTALVEATLQAMEKENG